MPKEKRNNLAIYTLAGSILLSSVIVSMNQSNAHPKDSSAITKMKSCINANLQEIEFAIMRIESGRTFFTPRNC
jgi:hypothetical protein